MQGVEEEKEEKEENEEGRRGPGVMLITYKAREGIGHLRRYRREHRKKGGSTDDNDKPGTASEVLR